MAPLRLLTTLSAALLFASAVRIAAAATSWSLVDNFAGSSFFDNFDFFTDSDPTHGFVQYVSQATANSNNLITTSGNVVKIYSDHTNVASSAGRMSVRLTSKKTYNDGLFIFDLNHMPFGCGTWPAIWTFGPNWPNSGEIDIIEGVNLNTQNTISLHTSDGCSVAGVARNMTGSAVTNNCYTNAAGQAANAGCGVTAPSTTSYGQGFNSNGGGIYAMLWDSTGIKVYFFRRGGIPSDITNSTPNPNSWPAPDAFFPFTSCSASHFANHQIVLDNTFCGDWAGTVFGQSGCSGSCTTFVQNNPSAFTEAYWSINSFKTYQASSAPLTTSTTTTSTTTTTTSSTSTCTPVVDRSSWTASASSTDTPPNLAIDGDLATRWTSGSAQVPGQWYALDLGSAQKFDTIVLDDSTEPLDYPRGYSVTVNGIAVATGSGSSTGITTITFSSVTGRYINITETSSASPSWWSLDEISVLLSSCGSTCATSSVVLNRAAWTVQASNTNTPPNLALDGIISTRWTSSAAQVPGQWYFVNLGSSQKLNRLVLDCSTEPTDYPHGYQVTLDGKVIATGTGANAITTITFGAATGQLLNITLTASTSPAWWSIDELNAYGPSC